MRTLTVALGLVALTLLSTSTAAHGQTTEELEDRCREDFDADHFIDIYDVVELTGRFGLAAGAPYDIEPMPLNGLIDTADIMAVTGQYGDECYGFTGHTTGGGEVTIGEGAEAVTQYLWVDCYPSAYHKPIRPSSGGFIQIYYSMNVRCYISSSPPPPPPLLHQQMVCVPEVNALLDTQWVLISIGNFNQVQGQYGCNASGPSGATVAVPTSTLLRQQACFVVRYLSQELDDRCVGINNPFSIAP